VKSTNYEVPHVHFSPKSPMSFSGLIFPHNSVFSLKILGKILHFRTINTEVAYSGSMQPALRGTPSGSHILLHSDIFREVSLHMRLVFPLSVVLTLL
jgi:hypothetical protein